MNRHALLIQQSRLICQKSQELKVANTTLMLRVGQTLASTITRRYAAQPHFQQRAGRA